MSHFAANNDPLTQVLAKLRTDLLADADIATLIKPANAPNLAGTDRNPIKPELMDADTPELSIMPTGTSYGPASSNTDHTLIQRFSVGVATLEVVLTKLFPVQFALYRAYCRHYRAYGSKIQGLDFDAQVRLLEGSNDLGDQNRKGTQGWSALLNIEVRMTFSNSDLDIT